MRIVAGRLRGRRLVVPKGQATRPTGERVREALFSILGDRVQGAVVADLFAGTGALGLEALSRGAASVTFYESGRPARAALTANIEGLDVREHTRLITVPLPRGLKPADDDALPYDLVLADPPWSKGLALPAIERLVAINALADGATLAIEEARGHHPSPAAWQELGITLVDERRWGDTAFQLLRYDDSTEPKERP